MEAIVGLASLFDGRGFYRRIRARRLMLRIELMPRLFVDGASSLRRAHNLKKRCAIKNFFNSDARLIHSYIDEKEMRLTIMRASKQQCALVRIGTWNRGRAVP